LRPLGLLSAGSGERSLQLQPRGLRGRAQTERREQLRRMRAEQCLDLGRREAGELRLVTIEEPPAPTRAATRDDRHPGGAQRIHVPQDGSLGDLQAPSEVARSEPAMDLQQQQRRDEPGGAHACTLAEIDDSGCRI